MDCSLPGSSLHGIFQARILEWVAISFSRVPSQPRNRSWVVLDVGGSTSDVSILELGSGVFEVLSTQGDMVLGGRDLDQNIADWMKEQCNKQFSTDISKDPMAFQRVIEAAEKAKIDLSNTTSTDINLPYLTVVDSIPQHFTATLTRAQFEKMAVPFMTKIKNLCEGALKAADMKPSDIDEILLVGGTTRVPKIQDFVKEYFGKEGNKSVNPDEAVALGAAIQGSILAGEMGSDIVLLDVTPMNLNITTMGDIATTMIEANKTIPCSHEQIFSTAEDNQTAITVIVTQGNRKIASQNKQLGVFNLDGIAPARRGVPQINVKFDLNANGVLEVTAKDMATNKEQSIRIEGSSNLSDEEIERMRKDAEEHEKDDQERLERQTKLNAAESLIYSVEKQLEDSSDKMSEEDKTNLTEQLDALKAVYNVNDEDRDMAAIESSVQNLQKISWEISAKLYKSDSSTAGFDPNMFTGANGFDPNSFK